MTKLDKDQLDKITGGAAIPGQPQNQNLDGGIDNENSTTLSNNEDLDGGNTGNDSSFSRNR